MTTQAPPASARAWIEHLLDPGFEVLFDDVMSTDPLGFPGYQDQLERARERTGATESVVVARGGLGDLGAAIVVAFEFGFLGGSMGVATAERIARAFERAAEEHLPVIALTASGGARMQEGMHSLAGMPATIAARERLAEVHQPFIAYLRNPTTGGVYASFASTADLIWAEPGATIGFAGPRVVEAQAGEPPTDTHTAETALRDGAVDRLVAPGELKDMLIALRWVRGAPAPRATPAPTEPPRPDTPAHELVARARDPRRRALDPAPGMLPLRSAHPSVRTGFTQIGGTNIVAIVVRADGLVAPRAYRDARRAIAIAERLALPIVTYIDTPGADPRSASERAVVAREIAQTYQALLSAAVPTVAIVTGEGGSGGALAFAACDRLLIQRDAIFSVISPEGAASILRRDDIDRLSAELKLTAHDLRELGLADLVVAEPSTSAPDDPDAAAAAIAEAIGWALGDIGGDAPTERRAGRWRVHRSTR